MGSDFAALGAGIAGGFANAARQKQQQDIARQNQQFEENMQFWDSVARDPRTNPAYLPQIMSGISQLHGLKPGKKDHDQVVAIGRQLSQLLQGGQGAPTDTYNFEGYQPVQQSSGMPAATSQPTQGGMVTMPPMPKMGSIPQQMDVQPVATSLNAGPGIGGAGLVEGPNNGVQQFKLPPMPQLFTPTGLPTADQSITKAEPAFINPYQAKAAANLLGIEARGEEARKTLDKKQQGDIVRDTNKYKQLFKGKSDLETQHNLDLVNRDLDKRKILFNGDEDAAQASLNQDYQNHVAQTLAKTAALEDESRRVDAYVNNINSEIASRVAATVTAGKSLQLKSDIAGYQGELKKLQADYKGISTELNALYGNSATFLNPDSKQKVADLEAKKATVLQKLSELKPPVVDTSVPAGKQTLTSKGGHAVRKPGQAPSPQRPYDIGDIITQDGKQYRVTGFDAQGRPKGKPVK